MNIKKRTWEIVENAKPGDYASRIFDIAILSLVFLNILAVIIGTVPAIEARYNKILNQFELVSIIIFTLEYIARLWSCTIETQSRTPIIGRMRFACRPMPLIDLLAILPFYLPFTGLDLRSFRILRLMRILRIAKVGRYYSSLELIKQVLKSKKEELILTSAMMAMLMILSASVLYYCENEVQPESFSSIPATMWWAVATLTTVGYGDIYPITIVGKLCASVIAILGIGMFALPTGILGAGFVEAIQTRKTPPRCPHCGKDI